MLDDRTAASHDLFDALLADYFDWVDQSQNGDIDRFLLQASHWAQQPELVDALRAYLSQTNDVAELVHGTLASWLELPIESVSTGPYAVRQPEPRSLPARFGDYELLEELGRGGMGVVYRARHTGLDRTVCVKMILHGQFAKAQDEERLLREARAMAALRHPHVVTVYEVGQRDGQYYISMEYIAGQSLAQAIHASPLDADLAARIVRDVADAISYAHQQRILHRDLKPSNIILDEQQRPHVTDFGLARNIDTGSLTNTGSLAGSPSYMAPEQTHVGRPASVACDVYGLGTVLYETLTGRPPFLGTTPLDTLLQVRTAEPASPSYLNPRVPRDLETICLKCLSKNPAVRYATAAELIDELDRFARGEPIQARPIGAATRAVRWCRRNPLPVAVASTVLLAMLVVGAALLRSNFVTSTALSTLSKTHGELQAEQARNEQLIGALRDERDQVANHLYLSRTRRISQAINHGDLVEADALLNDLVPGRNEPDYRGWDWYYLNALTRQESDSMVVHDGSVRSVVRGLEGGQVAAILPRELALWQMGDRAISTRVTLENASGVLAWDRQHGQLAIGLDDGGVELRSDPFLESAGVLRDVRATSAVRCLTWSANGEQLAAGYVDGSIVVWQVAAEQIDRRLDGHTDGVNALSFSHDGRLLASASDDATVRVYDVPNGSSLATLNRFRGWVNDVAFHPRERLLAAVSQSGELQVWALLEDANGPLVQQVFQRSSLQRGALSCTVWDPTGTRIATGSSTASITLWDATSGQRLRHLYGHRDAVTSLDWPSDETLLSSSADGTVKTWNAERAPDGGLITAPSAPVRYLKWNPVNSLVVWRDVEGLTSVWDRAARRRVAQFSEPAFGATAVAWHPRGDQLALAREAAVLVFGINGEEQRLRLDSDSLVWTVRWSPDGNTIATAGSGTSIQLWDAGSGRQTGTLEGHTGSVRTFCWTSNNQLCSADQAATIRHWNVAEQSVVNELSIESTQITSLAVNHLATSLSVTTEEGPLYEVDLTAMRIRQVLHGHQGPSWASTWMPGDTRLASAGQDGTLRLWDVASGEEALRIEAHTSAAWSLDTSPDGLIIATSGADGAVRFWDAGREGIGNRK